MTDTFELADNNGVRRFGGTAYAPGATPGDVFTVQADGSLLPEPGGGSQPVSVPISAAEILTLDSVFKELVAAPGPAEIILPTSIVYAVRSGTRPIGRSFNVEWGWMPTLNTLTPISVYPTTTDDDFSIHAAGVDVDGEHYPTDDAAGKALVLGATAATLASGAILTATIAAAGTGYAPGDTFDVGPDWGPSATGVVDTVGGGGAITSFHITDGAWGYVIAEGPFPTTATSGVGVDFTLDVASITPANSSLIVTVDYITCSV